MDPQTADDEAIQQRVTLVHREVVQLLILIAVAVLGFFATRAVAANNRKTALEDAAQWYERGTRDLAAGRLDRAVASFRRATARNRNHRPYTLALARALARNHDEDQAQAVLTSLRESAPEDPQINLELARLAGSRQDATEAIRFYHNALYAPWPPDQSGERRQVRLELIRFLLTHNQAGRAVSELLALSTDTPADARAHAELGQLFADAGDYADALGQFQQALRLDPDNGAALAGAGKSAFNLGNYSLARSYLRRVPSSVDGAAQARELADLVLSNDPLAARIGSAERRRRLIDDLSYAERRLTECTVQGDLSPERTSLDGEVQAFQEQLNTQTALEQDTIESGVDLVERVATHVSMACGPPTALDRAFALMARQRGTSAR